MEVTEPTNWYAGIVIVTKTNSQVRICVDLIKFKCREQHFIPALETLVKEQTTSVTYVDANSEFWQIELDPESSNLTTFTTPHAIWTL